MVHVALFYSTVPVDGEGIIPDILEEKVKIRYSKRPKKKPFWSLLYVVSTFHNPTGVCLSPGDPCIYLL